jgi:GH25 family lysozyme M1 (1,4-beta-N-acetylmuramidase)
MGPQTLQEELVRLSRLARWVLAAVAASLTLAGTAAADVTGPDVSGWQHPSGASVDWNAVRSAGHDFTFVKATEGSTFTNAYFAGDWANVAAAGLYRGAYHYARPTTAAGSAAAQARYFAATIGDQSRPLTMPPTLDMEEAGNLTPAQLVAWTKSFLTTLQGLTGRTPIIYTYPYFWRTAMGGSTAFTAYPLWIASYGTAAPPTLGWPHWTFWQYSATGSVRGIPGAGAIDVNRFNGSMSDLATLALTTAAPGGGDPTGITDPVPPALVGMSAPSRYVPVTPVRFVDTRLGLGAAKAPVTGPLTVTVPAAVPADATGVVLNASVVDPTSSGYVRVAAAGTTPLATALNFTGGQSTTGLLVTPIDTVRQATVNVYGGKAQIVLDVVGYYTAAAGTGGHWVPLAPSRIVDSRTAIGGPSGPQAGDVTVTLPDTVPVDATGVVLNVSVVEPTRQGYLRVAPAGTVPTTTALNYPAVQSATGLVLTQANARVVTVAMHGGAAQLVVDLIGYYDNTSTSGQAFVASTPQRVLDTRSGLGASGRGVKSVTLTLPANIPADATGAVLNLSAVSPSGKGYLRLAAAGDVPTTTAISFAGLQSVTGLALTPIGPGRQVTVTVYGAAVDVVADLVGFHTAGG